MDESAGSSIQRKREVVGTESPLGYGSAFAAGTGFEKRIILAATIATAIEQAQYIVAHVHP
jgi:hypothetical protein